MNYRLYGKILAVYFLSLLCLPGSVFCQKTGQPQKPPAVPSSGDHIDIRWSDLFSFELSGADTLKRLVGSVELKQDSVFLFCDSALIWNNISVVANGNFILQHGDSITIFSDSALYRSDTKIARLYGNVAMKRGVQKVFTDSLVYDVNTKIATYVSGATMTDDTTFLSSKKGYYHAQTDDIFFKDSVVVVSPDFTLRSDSLQFNAFTRRVTFVVPTLITQDSARIYTEAGFYDIDDKLALFAQKPQYVKNGRKAWAQVMRYDGNRKEVTLIGEANFQDSATLATAYYIRYNEQTEVTLLLGDALVQDKNRTITGDTVEYDARNETYATRGRSRVVDGAQILEADRMDYDKERELGTAQGNVVWHDTLEKLTVLCLFAEHSKKQNYLKASGGKTGRPLLIKVIDNDSLYLSADTLLSFRPPAEPEQAGDTDRLTSHDSLAQVEGALHPGSHTSLNDSLANQTGVSATEQTIEPSYSDDNSNDSARIILAFHDVRIYKSDLQAICDSLSYSNLDSTFRLYRQPVIWSDTSQFTADTILLQLANDKIDHIYLRNESFIVNSPDELFFNQIKGKHSTVFFEDGEIRRMRVEGNAESVYYALDEQDDYIGVNQAIGSEMLIFFGDNRIEGIRFYTEPKATLFPMKTADHEQLKLTGFSWQIQKRPATVLDILKALPKQSPTSEARQKNGDEEPPLRLQPPTTNKN